MPFFFWFSESPISQPRFQGSCRVDLPHLTQPHLTHLTHLPHWPHSTHSTHLTHLTHLPQLPRLPLPHSKTEPLPHLRTRPTWASGSSGARVAMSFLVESPYISLLGGYSATSPRIRLACRPAWPVCILRIAYASRYDIESRDAKLSPLISKNMAALEFFSNDVLAHFLFIVFSIWLSIIAGIYYNPTP